MEKKYKNKVIFFFLINFSYFSQPRMCRDFKNKFFFFYDDLGITLSLQEFDSLPTTAIL